MRPVKQRLPCIGLCFCAALFIIAGSLQAQNKSRTLVYIGGGDNPAGEWQGYLADTSAWTWVRHNADGYYVNVFPFLNLGGTTQDYHKIDVQMKAMANAFTNKDLFYETEAQSMENRVFDKDDSAVISVLGADGFNVKFSAINCLNGGSFPQSRLNINRGNGARPVLSMWAPWLVGGDITSNTPDAPAWRAMVDFSDGSATDGQLGVWRNNDGNVRQASYSSVKYSHAHNKTAMIMLCPYNSDNTSPGSAKTGVAFLSLGKNDVAGHEDNDAMPDVWGISYYAAQVEQYPVTPEQTNGQPAPTLTGMGYYLIHHLKDPDKNAQLQVPAQSGITIKTNAADIPMTSASKSIQVKLANSSAWLDLIPEVTAAITDINKKWNVKFLLGTTDVTASITGQTGLVFYQTRRLNPNTSQTLTITVSSLSGQTIADPLTIALSLHAHPTEPSVEQTLALNINPTTGVAGAPALKERTNPFVRVWENRLLISDPGFVANRISIIDAHGRTVYQSNGPCTDLKIPGTAGLSQGIYFVRLTGRSFESTQKILVGN